MTIDQAVEAVQFAYPQIYFACHMRHARRRSSPQGLSGRDSSILVHLDRETPIRLTDLARHLDLAASTLSEALSDLVAFGYVDKVGNDFRDRRSVGLRLTAKGVEAVRRSSVLEPSRLARILRGMKPAERRRAIEGLRLFAGACRGRS